MVWQIMKVGGDVVLDYFMVYIVRPASNPVLDN